MFLGTPNQQYGKSECQNSLQVLCKTKRRLKVRELQEHLIVIITATYLAYSEVASNQSPVLHYNPILSLLMQ